MIGPRPIETVGNSQKSGISQGCGYDDSPPPGGQLAAEVLQLLVRQPAFEERPGVDAGRGVTLEIDDVAVAVASPVPRKKWLKPTSYSVAAEAKVEMWPPMPSDVRLARTTIAIAFQRTRLLMRRSISRLPGSGGCSSGRIVLT